MNSTNISDHISLNAASREQEYLSLIEFKFHVHGLAGNLLAVFGLVANVLSIVVLSHHKMRSSTSYYLITLAVYDNIILIAMVIFFNLPFLSTRVTEMESYFHTYMYAVPIGYPLSLAAQMGSIYTTVAFTVERYIAVCRPLHAANTCTKSRARKTMGIILLWVLLYNIPRYFQYTVHLKLNPDNNITQVVRNETDFGQHPIFRHVYLIYFQLFFMFLIPFMILLVLNIALMKAVKRSRQTLQQISSTSRTNENNLTVMLISVIFVFLVCQFPSIIDNIVVAVDPLNRRYESFIYAKFYTISTFMIEINSAVNFILYCLFGKKFRLVFLHIFGLRKFRQRLQYRSTLYRSQTINRGNSHELEVSLV
ncbi:hypothetical protein SNE40_007553 [Patella caerulea]|uniref:G-protein coupled receptors family 1 profile domain-containing protein n=1 Tax=Patella caerulea TaxID=87958 RepID=A0AAN8JXX9_PATCE